jgi:hypothetical protein
MFSVETIKDPRQDIKFWLDALSNPNVNRESKELLNKCLYIELNNYLNPPELVAMCMGKHIFE